MDRQLALQSSGAAPGTYGDGSNIPVLVIDAQGRIIGVSLIAVSFSNPTSDFKESVRAATTANITLSGAQTIDGVSVIAGDRVLVKDQSTGANNGIYVCASGAWARSTDMDISAEATSGCVVPVTEGTANGDKLFMLTTNDPITLGSTSLTFAAYGTGGGAGAWSGLTDPSGNLSLAMAANLTLLTYAGNFGSSSAFKLAGNNTSATGPLLHLATAVSNLIPPFLIEPRTGQSFKADHLQNIIAGKSAPLNSDTDGFVYLPVLQSNTEPSATPTSQSGFGPLVLESDAVQGEYRLWAYLNSAWRALTPSGGGYLGTSGNGAQTLNFSTGRGEVITRAHTLSGGNATFTFTAPTQSGVIVVVILQQDASGSRTATWPGSVKWTGGAAPTLTVTAFARDQFSWMYDGTNYYELSRSLNVG